jgi:WD40 repeat protein
VWDVASGRELARIPHDEGVLDAAFSPDGKYIASGSYDRSARLWLWRAEDLVEEACARLTRNLSAEEWSRYIGVEPFRDTCLGLPAAQ